MGVTSIEHLWIPMSDGVRLAARLWLPDTAPAQPVPAILEYIPYRKRDGTRGRDEPMHGFFAEAGYAAVRVDMRGTGESDGHMADEYLLQEQDDALEVIAWIAAQPWCSGAVGMMGKSWGGFNALQVAARRPPALKAIITTFFTDNRYTDDIHYMGGCLLNDNLWWGAIMMAYQSRPPDPALVGEAWRAIWLERIAQLPLFPALWMAHPHEDAYWRHGSVDADYGAITCPVLAVGGWADAYTNSVPRLLARLSVPRAGIIGPWAHVYPQDGMPGPAIGFLQEATRWWDHWLKGTPNDVPDWPMLRSYIEDAHPPDGTRRFSPGRWVADPVWPSPAITPLTLHAHADRRLHRAPAPKPEPMVWTFTSPLSHGAAAGEWMGTGCEGENPTDQRQDDGGALTFDLDPLTDGLDLLGAPTLTLTLSVDQPVAQLCVRLGDIAPDGRITRISYQVLNLTHSTSHAHPEPMPVGTPVPVRVTLNACGYHLPAGHALRLSLATSYWPLIWPAPAPVRMSVHAQGLTLTLPVRTPQPGDADVMFPPPAHGPKTPTTRLDPGRITRTSSVDHVTGVATYVSEGIGGLFGEGAHRFDAIGTEVSHSLSRTLTIRDPDPLSARYTLTQTYALGRDGWRTRTHSTLTLTATKDAFHLDANLTAWEGEEQVAERAWSVEVGREGV